jgi:hypothetical protein
MASLSLARFAAILLARMRSSEGALSFLPSERDFNTVLDFVGKRSQAVHANHDVEQLRARSGQHRRIEVAWRNIRRADFPQGTGVSGFAEVLKPEVNVLRDDRRALQCGGRKPDDQGERSAPGSRGGASLPAAPRDEAQAGDERRLTAERV